MNNHSCRTGGRDQAKDWMYFLLGIPRKAFKVKKKPKELFCYQFFFYQFSFYQFQSDLCLKLDAECAPCSFIHFKAVVWAGRVNNHRSLWKSGSWSLDRNSVQCGKSGVSVQGTSAEVSLVHLGTAKLEPLREHFRSRGLPREKSWKLLEYPKLSLKYGWTLWVSVHFYGSEFKKPKDQVGDVLL